MYVINTTDGTAAHAGYQTQIGSAGNRVFGGILNYSVSYTTSGNTIAGEVQLYGSTACTGIAIRAYTAAPIRFITNDVEEVRLLSGGGLMINATSKVGSEELRVGGASQFDGELTLADAVNIVVNTTTGTKIGTATTQKLSVYNATPIVQGFSVRYERTSRLLHELMLSHADGSYLKLLHGLSRVKLLICDDWFGNTSTITTKTELTMDWAKTYRTGAP